MKSLMRQTICEPVFVGQVAKLLREIAAAESRHAELMSYPDQGRLPAGRFYRPCSAGCTACTGAASCLGPSPSAIKESELIFPEASRFCAV